MATTSAKLTQAAFTLKAIPALRQEGRKGLHTTFSGFSAAFKKYFGLDKDQYIEAINKLIASDVIEGHFAKGGMMLYLPGEMPARSDTDADKTLLKVLG